ncbi:5'-3' exonuclease [Marinimicrobium alkaliphilum]|uniref:5'-3' exonuclease n=1 Tax=Marinimicrobium alkaliphilum TaxID=2202654 RepID=UPI000DB93EFB|nr:5'-3' exonuclease H3TH domain-containing protein [Marinimicrobium alkaliphilum]
MTPALLIDASIYIFRYYFALPDNWFSRDEGYGTGAVYGYGTFLLRLLETERPSHIAACYDESLGHCFRNTIYPDYKASRALPDEALAYQLNACRALGECLGIASFASETHEADDLIGTLARSLRRSRRPIAIITRDKDLGQLLQRPEDYLWDPTGDTRTHATDLEAKLGIRPAQLPDYLALVGDTIDDIPGVPGVGAKTATALLQHFGTVEALLANLEQVPTLSVRGARTLPAKLDAHRSQIAIARQLAQIDERMPLSVRTADLLRQAPDWPALDALVARTGLGRGFVTRARRALADAP